LQQLRLLTSKLNSEANEDELRPKPKGRSMSRRQWNPIAIASIIAACLLAIGLAAWGGIYLSRPKHDARLIGTWISDAEATIADQMKIRTVTEKNEAAMRKLFGKMKVTFTANTVTTDMDGEFDTQPYHVISQAADSVTIKEYVAGKKGYFVVRMRFEDADTYLVDAKLVNLAECFRRVH
jgi:hypothetical protein